MCKALGSIPRKRKVPLLSDSLPVEALKEKVGKAEPSLTSHLLPPVITLDLSTRAEGIGGPQPPLFWRTPILSISISPYCWGMQELLFSKEYSDQRNYSLGIGWEAAPHPLPHEDGLMPVGCGGLGLLQRLWRFIQCLSQRPLSPPVFIYSKKTKGNLQSPD